MSNKRLTVVASVLLVFLVTVSAFSAAQNVKVKGMISGRTGDTLILNNQDGSKTTVVLDDSTKVQQPKGLGLRKKQVSASVLIPGLKVSVDGTGDSTNVTAKSITFDASDLETAEMIQAGLHPTAEQVAENQKDIATNQQDIAANQQATATNAKNISANQQATAVNKADIQKNIADIEATTKRFDDLTDYDVKGDLTVNFKVGSDKVSADDQTKLKQLAQSTTALKGYIVEVKGYADSTGNAAMNTELSDDRAQAVINILVQQGAIPIRHIVAPGAYGETNPAASNETASGRAENRRVEVKVLVNKGLAGS